MTRYPREDSGLHGRWPRRRIAATCLVSAATVNVYTYSDDTGLTGDARAFVLCGIAFVFVLPLHCVAPDCLED